MGNWSYNPTYRSYNPIYNWKGVHLVEKTINTMGTLLGVHPSLSLECGWCLGEIYRLFWSPVEMNDHIYTFHVYPWITVYLPYIYRKHLLGPAFVTKTLGFAY